MNTGLKQKLDYSDYACIPPDGKRYELLEGDLHVTPAPSPLHQRVSRRLQRKLEAYFEARGLGEGLQRSHRRDPDAPRRGPAGSRRRTDPAQVSGRGIEGPPALLGEILSPTTRDRDRTVKARRYAALGVRHYWLGEPEGARIECHRTEAHAYALVVPGAGDQVLAHPDWPGLALAPADLWR